MNKWFFALAVMSVFAARQLAADETDAPASGKFWPRFLCVCPDDCCKPFPKVLCPSFCGTCDDYCKKPMPKSCWLPGYCPDDYCCKPAPCVRGLPCISPYIRRDVGRGHLDKH